MVQSIVDTRKRFGYSQTELAAQSGISRRALVDIEAGGNCTLKTLRSIMEVLFITVTVEAPEFSTPNMHDMRRVNDELTRRGLR